MQASAPGLGDLGQLRPTDLSSTRHSLELASPKEVHYDNIYVFLTSWADDESRSRARVDLGAALETSYRAECQHLPIPQDNAQPAFQSAVYNFMRKASYGYNLVIFYYGGYLSLVDGQYHLTSSITSTQPQKCIEWNPILKSLEIGAVDVLILLDCPYTGRQKSNMVANSTEILAVSNGTTPFSETQAQRFTQSLKGIFEDNRGQPTTVLDLHKSLMNRGLDASPFHLVLSSGGFSDITIATHDWQATAHKRSIEEKRQVVIKVKLNPGRSDSEFSQSKSSVDEWLETALPPHEDLHPAPSKTENSAVYLGSFDNAALADHVSWQRPNVRAVTATSEATGPDLHDLVDSLNVNKSIAQNFPTINGRYTTVRVLPLMWENIEPHHKLEDDLKSVGKAFRERYNYFVHDIFKITSDNHAVEKVKAHIRDHIPEDEGWNELLIIVYAGHGMKPNRKWKKKGPMVFTDNETGDYELDWSDVQSELESAKCDVLVILNCCYGGNAALASYEGTNEILSAADRDSQTFSGKHSFLKYLTKSLNTSRDGGKITIESLSYELDVYNTVAKQQMLKRPLYKRYPESRPSIVLQALAPDPYGSRSMDSSQIIRHPKAGGESSFFVEYILTQADKASQEEWNHFFANSSYPNRIQGLRFYTSNDLPYRAVADH